MSISQAFEQSLILFPTEANLYESLTTTCCRAKVIMVWSTSNLDKRISRANNCSFTFNRVQKSPRKILYASANGEGGKQERLLVNLPLKAKYEMVLNYILEKKPVKCN